MYVLEQYFKDNNIEKIKQLKSNKIVECWHDKGLLVCPNKQYINISETNKTDLQNKNSEWKQENKTNI